MLLFIPHTTIEQFLVYSVKALHTYLSILFCKQSKRNTLMAITLSGNANIPLKGRGTGRGFTSTPVFPNKTVTVTGSGFGLAPNVIFYRDFQNGIPNTPIPLTNDQDEIGSISRSDMDYGFVHGETCALGFNHTGIESRPVTVDFPVDVQKYNFFSSFCIPPGKLYPSSVVDEPGDFGSVSDLKQYWFLHSAGANSDGTRADLAYNSVGGSTRLNGNTVNINPPSGPQPGWSSAEANEYWDSRAWTSVHVIQDCDLVDPRGGAVPHKAYVTNSKTGVVKSDFTEVTDWEIPAFNVTSGDSMTNTDAFYRMVNLNAYAVASLNRPKRSEIAYKDFYIAAPSQPDSEDYKQMVFLGNSPILANCTRRKAKVADSWSDTSVSVTVKGVEEGLYTHVYVMRANGTVEVVAI